MSLKTFGSELGGYFGVLFLEEKRALVCFGRRSGEWRSITAGFYSERIVPLMHGMVSMRQDLQVMQDNAPSHKSRRTIREFESRNISLMECPPYSPDLIPIETVWSYVKAYMERLQPPLEKGKQRN